MKAKALKVTISGSYRTADKEIIDYSGITGIVPYNTEDIVAMHIRKRYARMWIMKSKDYTKRLYSTRECYIDDMKECEADFSYLGKDIRNMTQEELQDLATAKDLRLIPLYKNGSERAARIRAYATYSIHVLKTPIDWQAEGFNLMKSPPIIVTDGSWRVDNTVKLSNEEILDNEQDIGNPKTTMNRSELEEIAKMNNVKFQPNISDAKLYQRLYG